MCEYVVFYQLNFQQGELIQFTSSLIPTFLYLVHLEPNQIYHLKGSRKTQTSSPSPREVLTYESWMQVGSLELFKKGTHDFAPYEMVDWNLLLTSPTTSAKISTIKSRHCMSSTTATFPGCLVLFKVCTSRHIRLGVFMKKLGAPLY